MRAIREVASKIFCLFLYVCLATLFECLQIVYVLQNLKLGQIRVPVSWKTLMPWYLGTFGHTVPMNLLSAGKWAISFFVEYLLFFVANCQFLLVSVRNCSANYRFTPVTSLCLTEATWCMCVHFGGSAKVKWSLSFDIFCSSTWSLEHFHSLFFQCVLNGRW